MNPTLRHHRQLGFSLIELMVGLSIGLIAMFAVYRVLSTTEQYRRATAKVGSSQESAAIAGHILSRDLNQAGFGLQGLLWYLPAPQNAADTSIANAAKIRVPRVYDCMVAARRANGTQELSFRLQPIEITQGNALRGDTLAILYGNAQLSPFPAVVQPPTPGATTLPAASSKVQVGNSMPFASNDLVVMLDPNGNPSHCEMSQLGTVDHANNTLALASDKPFSRGLSRAYATSLDPGTASLLFNLGSAPSHLRYSVGDNLNLTVSNTLFPELGGDVIENVLSLQAQYVFDDGSMGDAIVAPKTFYNVTGVRLGIVTRSEQPEKNQVSPATLVVFPASATNAGVSLNLDDSARYYRYRVQTVISPLRNRAWNP